MYSMNISRNLTYVPDENSLNKGEGGITPKTTKIESFP